MSNNDQQQQMRDFQDGYGPVPAHQHVNPDGSEGGWVAETASVASTCWVYGKARVYGEAQVSGEAWVCNTAHCLAGWVQVIKDDEQDNDSAYEAGIRHLPLLAPYFFASDAEAMIQLKKLAEGSTS